MTTDADMDGRHNNAKISLLNGLVWDRRREREGEGEREPDSHSRGSYNLLRISATGNRSRCHGGPSLKISSFLPKMCPKLGSFSFG